MLASHFSRYRSVPLTGGRFGLVGGQGSPQDAHEQNQQPPDELHNHSHLIVNKSH